MDRVMRKLQARYDIDRFVRNNGSSPYRILVGCVISLRTKDDVSYAATDRLFQRARTPREMIRLRPATIAKLIYPAGFYNRKAEQIREISRMLIDRHAGRVPDERERGEGNGRYELAQVDRGFRVLPFDRLNKPGASEN